MFCHIRLWIYDTLVKWFIAWKLYKPTDETKPTNEDEEDKWDTFHDD